MGIGGNFNKVDGPDTVTGERPEQNEQSTEETEVTNTVNNKCLLGSVAGTLLLVVVADQQIGAETDALPADKHDQGITTQNQHQHGESKEVQVTEESVVASLSMHIADGVEVDQGTNPGNHQNHHG